MTDYFGKCDSNREKSYLSFETRHEFRFVRTTTSSHTTILNMGWNLKKCILAEGERKAIYGKFTGPVRQCAWLTWCWHRKKKSFENSCWSKKQARQRGLSGCKHEDECRVQPQQWR